MPISAKTFQFGANVDAFKYVLDSDCQLVGMCGAGQQAGVSVAPDSTLGEIASPGVGVSRVVDRWLMFLNFESVSIAFGPSLARGEVVYISSQAGSLILYFLT